MKDVTKHSGSEKQNTVKFVYVHGTNLNTLESRQDFEQRVKRLHVEIMTAFGASKLIHEHLLQNGRLSISPEPTIFFWGDRSQSELNFLKSDLTLLEGVKTRIAGLAREQLAYMLHDAVWFERPKNKYQILKALHNTVMTAYANNQSVVLLGHSAGSLVTFNYLTYLSPFLDQDTMLRIINPPQDIVEAIRSADIPPICALALIESGAFRPDLSGRLRLTYQEPLLGISELSPESRKLYLARLPEALRNAAQTCCLPPHAVRGMITFGSPIALFESDVGQHEDVFSLLVSYMLKYLLENGMAWLHANHIKDPIGFPLPDYDEMIHRIKANQGICIHPQGGLIANNSNIRGDVLIQNAHGWYWQKARRFAEELVKTYEANFAGQPYEHAR
jgi:hypothetical protein